jgi:hypothetical protein
MLFFVILALVGTQLAVWWRLGPNESVAMFFLAGVLVVSTYSRSTIGAILFSILVCLMGLSKESFLLIIPAVVFFNIAAIPGFNSKSVAYKYLILSPLILFSCAIAYILTVRSAGVDDPFIGDRNIVMLITKLIKMIVVNWYYFIAIVVVLVPSFLRVENRLGFKKIFQDYKIELVTAMLIIVPNTYVYLNTGMYERYMLPTSIGFALLIAKMYDKNRAGLKVVQKALVSIILLAPTIHGWIHANRYGQEGKANQEVLRYIQQANESRFGLIANTHKHIEQYYGAKFFLEYYSEKSILATEGTVLEEGNLLVSEVLETSIEVWKDMYKEDTQSFKKDMPETLIFYGHRQIAPYFKRENIEFKHFKTILQNDYYTVLKLD